LTLFELNKLDRSTFDVVSIDVFDTALLRDNKGERRRFFELASELSRRLGQEGYKIDIDFLYSLRLTIQNLAYQAVAIERPDGDAALSRIQLIQCILLGLDRSFIPQMQEAEIATEKQSLRANKDLIKCLLALRAEGKRVIAISDMYLPAAAVNDLIVDKVGTLPIERTYVSSDVGLTKRSGKIFASVAQVEGVPLARMLHCGDHPISDVDMPRAAGMQAIFLPRPRLQRLSRKASALANVVAKHRQNKAAPELNSIRNKREFGRQILGPILAEFALKTWVLASNLERPNEAVLLFCARGGLRLKTIYEAFLKAAGLTSPIAFRPLMISRIVALRSSLLRGGASAFEQIGYEFSGRPLREVVRAIAGIDLHEGHGDFASDWNATYSKENLEALMASNGGREFVAAVTSQDNLFRKHLESCSRGSGRTILCDTGLFGSTLQLLDEALPEKDWSCLLLARANYKGFATPHFSKVFGLAVQADRYSPLNLRTALLRHWHLVEATLEPPLPSVRSFTLVDGLVKSNLELDEAAERLAGEQDEIFSGALDYINTLTPNDATFRIMSEVEIAFRRLHSAIVWPTQHDSRLLDFADRSMDFGRDGSVPVIAREGNFLQLVRKSHWRAGVIAALAPPLLRLPLLALLEAIFVMRWLLRARPFAALQNLFSIR
jgi:FMN phosphatase YigB (HAD superfamily)